MRLAKRPLPDHRRPLSPEPEVIPLAPMKLAESPNPVIDADWNLFVHGVTQGFLAQFIDCPQRTQFAYVDRLSMPRTGGALAFGSLVHEILDRVYSGSRSGGKTHVYNTMTKILAELYARDLKAIEAFPSPEKSAAEEMEMNYGMAGIVLKHYFERWESDFSQFHWLALEKVFDVPYPTHERLGLKLPNVPVRGKRDGDLRIDKPLFLFETKTKGRIEEENILDPLSYNLQVQLYMWAMNHDYGERPHGVIYNLIRRPQLRQGKSENVRDFLQRVSEDVATRMDFYFIRYNCAISPEEQRQWELEFDEMMERVIRWAVDKRGHYRNANACTGRAGACTYLPLCGRNARELYQKRSLIYPELAMIGEGE